MKSDAENGHTIFEQKTKCVQYTPGSKLRDSRVQEEGNATTMMQCRMFSWHKQHEIFVPPQLFCCFRHKAKLCHLVLETAG